ncbi:TonB-dependent receptor [Chryseobacterium lacus]|uniref:TonB-dependent receptor n=1 Tax=Chryseobacterium lacus TaxID=2058346 RepID=UPI000F85EB63|nr:TonB-dependent receptor plug domain-containing protein [Chryseobacterium lacus]RST25689.1 TonB-dependent receptor [Chryseobacterium lacus]
MKGLFFLGLCAGPFYFAQTFPQDSLKVQEIQEVTFTKRLPVAKEIINVERNLGYKNLGQDLPILLKNQTSVVATSDAGNGIGYTGFRIRGVSGTSINVMMNGIPYNDSESQGTFFVNVPDLTSSASQILIQRGVGTSSNGVSAFGASVNVISKDPEKEFYVKSDNSFGSFNTYKYAAEIGSGKFWKNRLSIMGRYTGIHSDGYIDRASSDLHSYNFTALFEENKTRLRLLAFGGKEKTYQSWNGIDRETYQNNPTFNYSGAIYDANWENIVDFYDNETDNYRQNHFQLLWDQNFGTHWNLETTLHYTKGKGYYENYKQEDRFSKYNLPNQGTATRTDFIRKKWLDNDFYGMVSTLYGKFDDLNLQLGVVGNQYYGRHFGRVSGVFLPEITDHEYYRNNAVKNEISGFAKAVYHWNYLEFFGDLQMRNIGYDSHIVTAGDDEGLDVNKKWSFFNPKAGVSYRIPSGKIFFSYALAHREPTRDDLQADPDTRQEQLHDFELGLEKQIGTRASVTANAYYMNYKDQLVLSGVINNIGEFIRENADESYRMGIELGALWRITDQLEANANLTLSRNKIKSLNSQDEDGTPLVLKDTDISFSPGILSNLRIQYQATPRFSVGLSSQYVGEQYLNNTASEAFKLDAYFTSDFNAQYTLPLRKTELQLKFLLNNIFDHKYINNGYVYDTDPYYFPQAGINFMLGMSVTFR